MSAMIFTPQKVKELAKFCSTGYDAWGKVIKKDTANHYVAGRDLSATGQAYWDSFNNEVSCILAIHSFIENYLSSKTPKDELERLKQVKSNFGVLTVEYKRQCSTDNLVKNVDKKIAKNRALKRDRLDNIDASLASLGASVNGIASKINGILGTLGALKSMKNNLASSDAPWDELYKTLRRDFYSVASNIIGIFAPTAVGNSIIVAWMSSDFYDYQKFEKSGQKLSEHKQEILKVADKFSGNTKIGEFYTYVLVTALAEHYGFSPNNGIKLNLEHKHLNIAKGILS
ncbi:hypothetical protein [Endozoicomonas arenosclerae]|uniref:hypothetical protein n=1 Tax=Endozoicomonas arenosclerae TaxID=1633495 RepID=UPI0007809C62|nr:hypothetical protein [Endozoicomonas arenosclerae]